MKKLNLVLTLPLLVSAIFISGCSTVPKALQVADNTVLTNFLAVKENANADQGNSARWGGGIAKVTNNANDSMLEVVHFPLKSSTRPIKGNKTQGRFRFYFSGLLDPIIYKEGLSITALGNVSTSEDGKIGEHEYTFPVLKASHIHLWKEIQKMDVQVTHQPFRYNPPYWRNPHFSNIPRRVVVKKSVTPAPVSTKKKE